MFRLQKWHIVRKASAVRWLLFLLIVLGSYSLTAEVYAQQGFSSKSIQGTWAFSADGMLSPYHEEPFALAGRVTFEEFDQCLMSFTVNEGGTSSLSTSDTCTFSMNPDGTGWLQAEFGPGAVIFPELTLYLVVADREEILAITTETVVASGILRRQESSILVEQEIVDDLQARATRYFEEQGIDVNVPPTDEEFAEGQKIADQLEKDIGDGPVKLGDWHHKATGGTMDLYAVVFYAYAAVSFTHKETNQKYCWEGHAGGLGGGVHALYKATVLYNDLNVLLGAHPFGIVFAGKGKGSTIVGWGSRGVSGSVGGTLGIGAFGGSGHWSKC